MYNLPKAFRVCESSRRNHAKKWAYDYSSKPVPVYSLFLVKVQLFDYIQHAMNARYLVYSDGV